MKINKSGGSLIVRIPQNIREHLGIVEGTTVEVAEYEGQLVIRVKEDSHAKTTEERPEDKKETEG